MSKVIAKNARDQAVKVLKRGFIVSGDGVAHRDMHKAVKSAGFKSSVDELLGADLVNTKG